ncbi:MAG: radical SAM protein [Candidatus Bathyarchaeota archaeon]|nr:radical SAM protein [Candidatus Bathyarchaeota archaeon]
MKPFYHYWPGSVALTFSTWSCNFPCPWCQNWHLSKFDPDPYRANYIPVERMVDLAVRSGCKGLSVSFTEPTLLFEYCLDLFPLARSRGLYCNFVSNGYMTLEALRMLVEAGMDGLKIDVKGCSSSVHRYCSADVDVCWRNASKALEMGVHVEIVNLVIPGVNDSEDCIEEVCRRHVESVGDDTPIHFTAYYPAYKFNAPPTSVSKLEEAYRIAKRYGLRYVYIGNVPGHPYENTYCPVCGDLLIKRYGLNLVSVKLTRDKKCPRCGCSIPIRGEIRIR